MMPTSRDYLQFASQSTSPKNMNREFFEAFTNNLACILLAEGKRPAIFAVERAGPVCVLDGLVYDPRNRRPESFDNYIKRETVKQIASSTRLFSWLEVA